MRCARRRDAAIIDGGGFGWVNPPGRRALESYFRGVLLVPERELFVARLNGDIVGSAQLVRPPRNNEAQAFAAQLMHSFIAPYARGHGLARTADAARGGAARATRLPRAESRCAGNPDGGDHGCTNRIGFVRWGEHPGYARVRGKTVRGFFLLQAPAPAEGGQRPMTAG